MNKKAIVLLSGGLDSILATKLLLEQDIDVTALHFTSPFCTCTSKKQKSNGCSLQAKNVSDELKIPIKVVNKGWEYIKVIENPKYGYGSGINPCIDCRIFMLKKTKKYMKEMDASFIATGEVLNQRPMSQHMGTIKLIEKESGLQGLILRPLSAKFFEPTIPEKEGIVDREKLMAISGRSRKEQIKLANEFGIKDYPCPAGGCLLTEKHFKLRFMDLFDHVPDYSFADVRMLKYGRHFRYKEDKFIIGRDEKENKILEKLADKEDYTIFLPDFNGPTGIVKKRPSTDLENIVSSAVMNYTNKVDPENAYITIKHKDEKKKIKIEKIIDRNFLDKIRIG